MSLVSTSEAPISSDSRRWTLPSQRSGGRDVHRSPPAALEPTSRGHARWGEHGPARSGPIRTHVPARDPRWPGRRCCRDDTERRRCRSHPVPAAGGFQSPSHRTESRRRATHPGSQGLGRGAVGRRLLDRRGPRRGRGLVHHAGRASRVVGTLRRPSTRCRAVALRGGLGSRGHGALGEAARSAASRCARRPDRERAGHRGGMPTV